MSLVLKVALSPLLVAQVLMTRAKLPRLPEPAGERQGVVGRGPALHVLVAGDSSAAGVGVVRQDEALARQLAHRLAQRCAARVHWTLIAQSGLTTAQTLALLQQSHWPQADLAIIVTGVNDVVDQVPSHRAIAARDALVNHLRNARGVQRVVFAPLPPVHHFPGLPQPLRWVAGADAKRHNAALVRWAATRTDVSCVAMEVPLNRGVMAEDGFHPGEPVYRYCAAAIAEHVAAHITTHTATKVWPSNSTETSA